MQFIGIIPARYGSVRFPGKPLVMIQGESMIQRVYEQALTCKLLNEVVVATDDRRIFEHVSAFGKVVMTGEHASGTDRCLEAFEIINENNEYNDSDGIINIQGDEPFIDPEQIEQVCRKLRQPGKNIVTLAKQISQSHEIDNPNVVKVVFSLSGKALYFSRLPIPYRRGESLTKDDVTNNSHFKHLGLYAYRAETLKQIANMQPGPLEVAEKLEQLRWMQQDLDIFVEITDRESFAIDTPEDVERLEEWLLNNL